MNRKNNQKFLNTQNMIQQTLLELLESKELRQISIQEICKKSGINRSTFYAHYLDKYDLMKRTENQLNHRLLDLYEGTGANSSNFFSPEYIAIFLQFIKRHQNFYRDFVNNHQSFPIEQGFDALWHNVMKPYYLSMGLKSEAEMMYHFVFFQAGFTMVLKRWLDHGCKETPEKLGDILLHCITINQAEISL